MYSNFPIAHDVNVTGSGSSVVFELTNSLQMVPQKCQDFLVKLGWRGGMSHPDTQETLYQKYPPDGCTQEIKNDWNHDLQFCYWHWYEAMAYEFSKFMGIEEDTGGDGGIGADAAGATAAFVGGREA